MTWAHRGIARRDVLGTLGVVGAGLTCSRAALSAPPEYDPLSFVAPALRPSLKGFERREVGRVYTADWVLAGRGPADALQKPLPPGPWRAIEVPVPDGRPPVTIYLVNERKGRQRGGVVHMHGGGYVFGSARSTLPSVARIARELDCTIVSVEYRLAPETTYQGSREDTYAALKWLHANAAEVGVDPTRIALLGDSAGGGHAALLAITARDRGEVPVAFQCLVYPMLDDRTGSTVQRARQMGEYVWTPEANVLGWRLFLGREPGQPELTDGVPGRVASVAGLPPAWIGVGGVDLFMEEDIAFGERLLRARIGCKMLMVPGAYHSFDYFAAGTPQARRFIAAKMTALKSAIG